MDIKYRIKNEYMKCVLQINGFSGLRPRVRSSRRVGLSRGGGGGLGDKGDAATDRVIIVVEDTALSHRRSQVNHTQIGET